MAYPPLPTVLVESWENPYSYTAEPLQKQINGGVQQFSVAGLINVTSHNHPFRAIVLGWDNYNTIDAFFKSLNGFPFAYDGSFYKVPAAGIQWTTLGEGAWELSVTFEQVYRP